MDYLLVLAIAALLTYRAVTSRKWTDTPLLLCFMLAALAAAAYEHADVGTVLLGVVSFNALASTVGSKANYAFLAICAAYALAFSGAPSLVAQAMLLGFLSMAGSFSGGGVVGGSRRETRRDFVQIAIGAALIIPFALLDYADARLFLIFAVLLGLLISDLAISNRRSKFSRFLYGLERKGVVFGRGAMWLALGALVAIVFLGSREAIVLLLAIFIGDAAATIIGMRCGSTALPYNRKKSALGSAAYFAITLALAFPLIGYAAIPVSLAAALVESLPRHIDDNFDTAVAIAIFILLLGYAGLI